MKPSAKYTYEENVVSDKARGHTIAQIEDYIHAVKKEILKVSSNLTGHIKELTSILTKAQHLQKEVMLLGINQDYHTASHANADFLKMNHLKVTHIEIPQITAFGNDYAYPYNFKEVLKCRGFGHGNVLIAIQPGEPSELLEEAFKYNYTQNGINVLIGSTPKSKDNIHLFIPVASKKTLVAGDMVQVILHFISAHLHSKTNPQFVDKGAESIQDYCALLLQNLDQKIFSNFVLADIAQLVKKKIQTGNTLLAFGNGGSAALSSYFVHSLQKSLAGTPKIYRSIIDITSYTGHLTESLHRGSYKSSVFTQLIRNFGVEEGDILFGVSSSGNSENIIHPFTAIPEAVRIGILGFGDGGMLGSGDARDIAFIVPDAGGFKSYQRAEDGQRIAISSILSTFSND